MSSITPAGGVGIPQPYQLTHQAGADQGAYGGAQSLGQYNLGGQNLGQYQNLAQQGVNNPYAGLYQQGAGQAGGMGIAGGQQAYGAGGQLMNSGLSTLPDVTALLNLGFDPQNALYARTQQQVQDQSAAQASASGVGGTPYGQGLMNQNNSNFNIDWQNNELQRAATGASAAGGLMNQAGSTIGQGADLQSGGIQELLQGYGQPYNTFQGINANALNTLLGASQYGQGAAAIPQMQIQDYMSYLNQANQNAQTQNQSTALALNKSQQEAQQLAAMGQGIGQLAGMGMGGGFGGGGFGQFGMNPFSSFFGGGGSQNGYNPYQYAQIPGGAGGGGYYGGAGEGYA